LVPGTYHAKNLAINGRTKLQIGRKLLLTLKVDNGNQMRVNLRAVLETGRSEHGKDRIPKLENRNACTTKFS
jgi:hypothetical protein